MRLLIAEDEPDMQRILRLYLEKAGYETDTAPDGEKALDMLCRKSYDLLIADWMMPRMSGIQLCREIRACSLPVKIIMLTAKSGTEDEITGLSCGADDYIRKPFTPQILLLRIKKLLHTEEALSCGELTLHTGNQTLHRGREEIRLTQKEYSLLQVLMQNQGITLSRDLLIERVWGEDYQGDERTLDTHIRRLRGKIGNEYIGTYVGMGYRMSNPYE